MNELISILETRSYYIQQTIYQFLSFELKEPTLYTIVLLFIGGLLTSFNPCFISINPIIISYINYNKKNPNYKFMILTGLISSFVTLIIFGIILNNYSKIIILNTPIFTSSLIIVIGLNFLNIINLNSLNSIILKYNIFYKSTNIPSFILGFIFGLSSCSCSTPILASLTIWLHHNQNFVLGIAYIIIYTLGYITPVIILIEITNIYNKITAITKIWRFFTPLSGSFCISIGFFSLLENLFYTH